MATESQSLSRTQLPGAIRKRAGQSVARSQDRANSKDHRGSRPGRLAWPRLTWFQVLVHIGALTPLAVLIWDALHDNLTVNPIQAATLRTGKTALVLLVLSLACTPLNTVFGFRQALRVRRSLGLYAFLYVTVHLTIYVVLDYGLDWYLLWLELAEKRYVLAGFAAFLILLPLAITSTRGWQRRLKRGWKRLHRLVYLAGLLVAIHFVWLVKSDVREPLAWGAGVVLLLVLRLPSVRQAVVRWRSRITSSMSSPARTGFR